MPKAERLPFVDESDISPDHLMLIERLNDWENSTPETTFRNAAPIDYKFYAGKQDNAMVLAILAEQNRPASVFNEIKPKIDMLIGMAAQTKFQPDVVPTGKEDEPLAELMGGALAHYSKKSKFVNKCVDCFQHVVKVGRSMMYFYIDTQNPFKPVIKMKRLPGTNFIVDPQSIEYDMSDARGLFIDKWMTEADLKAFWPHIDINQLQSHIGQGYPLFWNEQDDLYRVVEAWYRKWVKMRWFINPLTGKEESLTIQEFRQFAEVLKAGVPMEGGQRQVVPVPSFYDSMVQQTHYMLFSDLFTIEGGVSPYNYKHFPGVLFGAYKDDEDNSWFGAIRPMLDPQVSLNTMRRQLLHLLQTLPKGILKHEIGAILNIEEYEKRSADPSFHLEMAKGAFEKVGFEKQPPISPIYQRFDATMSQSMKDTSGIQDDLMGIQQTSREPGITVQARQQSGIAVLYILYDNFRQSRLECGRIYLSFIQQYATAPEIIRIEGEKGKMLMQINTQMNPESEGFNDISTGEYDLEMDEQVENSTLRLAIAQMLADFSQNNPGSIPPGIIMDYANLPFTVKEAVQKAWEEAQQREQENIDAERALKIVELSLKFGVEQKKIAASVEVAKQTKEKTND